MNQKEFTFLYLKDLEVALQIHINTIDITSELEKSNLRRDEDKVVAEIFYPTFREFTKNRLNLTENQLGECLLLESYKKYAAHFPEVECPPKRSGARTIQHPFTKELDVTGQQLYSKWLSGKKGEATQELWPDFGVQLPGQLNLLFEAKYFRGNSGNGKSELAHGLYEASFYRGLPFVYGNNSTIKWQPFEYACYITLDASKDHKLKNAYDILPVRVKNSFWESAAVYPMILVSE